MKDVSRNDGRTILFVSHNLPSLKAICERGILLDNGQVVGDGAIHEIIEQYTQAQLTDTRMVDQVHYFSENIQIHRLEINGSAQSLFHLEGRKLHIKVEMSLKVETPYELDVHIKSDDFFMASYANFVKNEPTHLKAGDYEMNYEIDLPELKFGKYKIDLYFTEPYVSWMAVLLNSIHFEVINNELSTFLTRPTLNWGRVILPGTMSIKEIR